MILTVAPSLVSLIAVPGPPPSLPLQQVSPDWQRHLGSSLNTLSSKLSP